MLLLDHGNSDMSFGLVDFHCHLDLYSDMEAVIAAAEAAKVYTLTVTNTPKAWQRNHDLTVGTHFVHAALGLHPQLVAERADELSVWENYLNETRYIGEVGLDAGPRYYKSLDLQKRIFKRILTCCAEAGGKILTVHSIRSASHVIDLIETYLPPDRGRIVMHWFTGSSTEARRAVQIGCFFSINAKMADNKNGKQLIASLPLDRILTETDGPFTKNPHGQLNNPIDVADVVNVIARIRNVETKEINTSIEKNLQTLIGLKDAVASG